MSASASHFDYAYIDNDASIVLRHQFLRYSEHQTAIIIRQVLSAVSYMHKRQCVHRDLKVENILYQSDDPENFTIKIIDFGLSKTYGDRSSPIPDGVGTIYTMAPEALSVRLSFFLVFFST